MYKRQFQAYLRKGGRSPSAARRCVRLVSGFQDYLQALNQSKDLDGARPQDLEAFVLWVESAPRASAKTHLWAICYYYDHTANEEMRDLAKVLRRQRIKRKPFSLASFRGVNQEHIQALATEGIENVDQMLRAGRTARDRESLAAQTGVPRGAILELVKLSDLARIPGLKGIRARLYCDAGVDTVERLAQWEPEALRLMLEDFVERIGFGGIAPVPKEVAFTVTTAQRLPRVVDYGDEA